MAFIGVGTTACRPYGAEWGYGAASAQTIRQVASDVKEVLIERCGHCVPEERPVELAGAIMDFLIKSSSGH
jgi:pimeloyl-ACP methyl ester carboxylesterase